MKPRNFIDGNYIVHYLERGEKIIRINRVITSIRYITLGETSIRMTVKDDSEYATIRVYFDGLCQPCNPDGLTCYSFIVDTNEGQRIHSEYGLAANPFTDSSTNNVVEYTGIVKALEWLLETHSSL